MTAYVANPIGSYTGGRNSAVLWPREDISGVILWGRPDEHDVELVIGALEADMVPDVPSHASVIDLRRLEFVDLRAFNKLSCLLASRWERLNRVLTRQALLHGGDLLATIVGAFYSAVNPRFPVETFADLSGALAWVGLSDRAVLEDFDDVYRNVSSSRPLLPDVRARLSERPASTLEDIAEAVGISARTLQRRLCELGTSFQQEASQARLLIAKTLMRETNDPLKCIALDCGCASLQHFSAFFRERVGMPPSRWRASQRA